MQLSRNYIARVLGNSLKVKSNMRDFRKLSSSLITINPESRISTLISNYQTYLDKCKKHYVVNKIDYENVVGRNSLVYKDGHEVNYYKLFSDITFSIWKHVDEIGFKNSGYNMFYQGGENANLVDSYVNFLKKFIDKDIKKMDIEKNVKRLKDTQNTYVKKTLVKTVEKLRTKKVLKRKSDFDVKVDSLEKAIPCVHIKMNIKNGDSMEILNLIQKHFDEKYSEHLGDSDV